MRLALTLALTLRSCGAVQCAFAPSRLTVDYIPSQFVPGVDAPESFLPRLSAARAPLLGWWLEAANASTSASAPLLTQGAYRIVVATSPALLSTPDVWDSGRVSSADSVAIPYGGRALPARSRVFWQVELFSDASTSCGMGAEVGAWEVPLLTAADWSEATWITRDAPHPPPADCAYYDDSPAPLFRTQFTLAHAPTAIVRSRLYISGLGYFTPYLNGAVVGDEALAPGWTDFNTTVLFSTHDVTAALTRGGVQHVLGIALGRGWFDLAPLLFWGHKSFRDALPTGDLMSIALLVIDYTDGSTQHIATNPSSPDWRVGGSEALFDSIYLGTRIDRRVEPVGWSTTAFDATSWPSPHAAVTTGLGALTSQLVPPVRRQAPVTPTLLPPPSTSATELTLDLGKQLTGVCNFCFGAGVRSGDAIHFRYGELLYANGSVNGLTSVAGQIKNGNGGPCAPKVAFQEDHYVFRGDAGGECFTPPWTWHSGRYIMLTGDAAALSAFSTHDSACFPLRSDVDVISTFSSSEPVLDAIYDAAVTTFGNNLVSVQSDCPARERLGYGGDALMVQEAVLNVFDLSTFLEKRLADVVAAQRPNGGFTETAPFVGISDAGLGGGSGPIGWQTYLPAAAMWSHKYHGNTRAVADSYSAARAYVAFLDTEPPGIENGLGDWMPIEHPAVPLTGRGFQHISYLEFANMSAVVGNASASAFYAASASRIAALLNERFLDVATGVYRGVGWNATQCGQAMPLFLQIVPPAQHAAALDVLAANVVAAGNHLTVGSFGVKYLLQALVDGGHADLAFNIVNSTTYPGFGFMLANNATTFWESWFASDDTFSQDHPMFGSVAQYLLQGLGGISPHPSARGMDRVLIRPAPPSGVTLSVNATLTTVRGTVSTSWHVSAQGVFELTLCVPPNMHVEVWLPSGSRTAIGTCCGCVFTDTLKL